jgi:hypothetical protein
MVSEILGVEAVRPSLRAKTCDGPIAADIRSILGGRTVGRLRTTEL